MISKIFPLHWIVLIIMVSVVIVCTDVKAILWISPVIALIYLMIRIFDYRSHGSIVLLSYYFICVYCLINLDYKLFSGLISCAMIMDYNVISEDRWMSSAMIQTNKGWIQKMGRVNVLVKWL